MGEGGQPCAIAERERTPWHLWPDNVRAWGIWCAVQTQWRVGMAGATGLDYAGVWRVIESAGIARRRRDAVFESLQAMERVALEEWARKGSQRARG
ncbi:DUF1799 domain-containing protein [Leptothrix discophora]|uniref:DUF1799 domain-containing protein n=1 Tax=Leptothrix discophora TaxID=89 RepID=A0ABT9G1R3_LEPDI|nr:DUF1799 domain-containing protein [Leptothrix discophora]MDP4300341.1 DUF1799 domain-containing protein [Leptothrix discophora]